MLTIKGAVAPVFTPTNDDGSINHDVIPEYCQYLSLNEIKAVLVAGTSGEASCLSVDERKTLASTWVMEAKRHDMQVMVQVGAAPLPDVLELARHAQEINADAILTLPELYFKPKNSEQLVEYLKMVSESAPALPLLYYHFPMMSGVDVNMEEFFGLAVSRIPNFKGLKADTEAALQISDHLIDDRRVFVGNHLMAPAALLGQTNSIATITNLFPKLVQDILESINNSDVLKARALQKKLNASVKAIASQGDWVPSMKWAMEITTGLKMGPPRSPITKLSEKQKKTIEDGLKLLLLST